MALSFANLTSGGTTTDATLFNTASISPGADRLLLLAVNAYIASGSTQPPAPTVAGNGLTWVEVGTKNDYDTSGTDRSTQFLYRAMGALPVAGAVTISFDVTTIGAIAWAVDEVSGCDTSGTSGSGAVVQNVKAIGAAVTTLTATLAAFADASNAGYGFAGHQAAQVHTPGSGWTELADVATISTCSLQTQYQLATDTTCDTSWATSSRCGQWAVEVKVASGTTPIAGSDTGSGADTSSSVAPAVTASETGTGADSGSTVATQSAADTATGADTASIGLSGADDTATGADASVLTAAAAGSETGTGADTGTLAGSLDTGDTGAGADASSVVVAVSADDTGVAVDAATVDTGSETTEKAGDDTGTGADASTIAAAWSTPDTAASADTSSLASDTAASDTATAVDSAVVTITLTGTDVASAADLAILAVSAAAAELGALVDSGIVAVVDPAEPTPPERIITIAAASRTLAVEALGRTVTVAAEVRALTVESASRTITVPAESRMTGA